MLKTLITVILANIRQLVAGMSCFYCVVFRNCGFHTKIWRLRLVPHFDTYNAQLMFICYHCKPKRITINCLHCFNCDQWGTQNFILGRYKSNYIHCVSKNDTDIAHYNFDPDKPILIILAANSYEVYAIHKPI